MNNFLNKFSIITKVFGSTLFVLFLMLINAGYTFYSMNQVDNELQAIAKKDIPVTKLLTLITEHQLEQAIIFEKALRFGYRLGIDTEAASHFKENIHQFEQLNHQLSDEFKKAESYTDSIVKELDENDKMAKEFLHVRNVLRQIEQKHSRYEQQSQEVFTMLSSGKIDQSASLIEKVEKNEHELNKKLQSLLLEIDEFTEQALSTAEAHQHDSMMVILALCLFAFVVGLFYSWQVVLNISTILKEVSNSLNNIADGDLTENISIQGDSQLSTSLTHMQQQLIPMVSLIIGTTDRVTSAAKETSSVAHETKSNIKNQQTETDMATTAMKKCQLLSRRLTEVYQKLPQQ